MQQNMPRRAPPQSQRREHLELLRLQGARHRLELALAQEELQTSAEALARGPRLVLSILRALGSGESSGTVRSVLRAARWIIPLAGTLFFGTRFRRTMRRLRTALAAGAIAAVLLRFLRQSYRKP